MQFFIKTQTPVVELKVTATDASGQKDSCLTGFKRHSTEESEQLLKDWIELLENEQESFYSSEAIADFIAEQVSYIKNYQLVDAEGKPALKIADTRTAQNDSPAWGASENCLPWLLGLFLDSAPWRDAFSTALVTALTNRSAEADSAKN